MVAALVAALVLRGVLPTPGSSSSPAAAGSPASAPAGPAQGDALSALARASVPATSTSKIDGAGRAVAYDAGNMLDGDPETAWRMDGDGTGEVLTFTLDSSHPVTSVGLVNGYAKTDQVTGEDRYAQGRRVTNVTWEVGGKTFSQGLRDGDEQLQSISFPPARTSTVRLRIDSVTAPGDSRFDHTAISEVQITGT